MKAIESKNGFKIYETQNGFIVHFLDLLKKSDNLTGLGVLEKFEFARRNARKIGGKEYKKSDFGGGFIFQTSLSDLENKINNLKNS